MPGRVVMLTDGNPHGLGILEGLTRRRVAIDAVVMQSEACFATCLEDSARLGPLRRLAALGRYVVRRHRAASGLRPWRDNTKRIVLTGALNGARMRADLEAARPDWLVLGGIGILDASILGTARQGVLNAHPGLLPWIRGTGVVGRALERGIAVGATTHFVNAGIDLGDVIERRLVAVTGKERGLANVEEAAGRLAIDMMVDLVAGIATGAIDRPPSVRQRERFPICKWLSEEERQRMDAAVREGLAGRLFERWRVRCDERLRLPADLDVAV
ncbi:MAG TPA: formyltransferase family protein [Planctomycetota bacterium]|nr:formyltransferase family protein [Planctomycetota bacterium]